MFPSRIRVARSHAHRQARALRSGAGAAALALSAAVLVAACGSGASPAPSPTPPSSPSPSGGADASAYLLRATTVQALPPSATFGWLPSALVTGDLRLVVVGPQMEMYPGPLLPNLIERQLTAAGWRTIVDGARAAGLLSGKSDFTGGDLLPGSSAGRLELVVDGTTYDLTGDPAKVVRCGEARCPDPEPGSPFAFAGFWARLGDIGGWLGADAGPERGYVADRYAILVGPPPAEEPPLSGEPVNWPLATRLEAFGLPVPGPELEACGTVSGTEADSLRAALAAANQLTRWRDADLPNTLHGLVVRPVLPGEPDPCLPLVGGG